MTIEIQRLGATTGVTPHELLALVEDFKRRADPKDVDGWTVRDMVRIMVNCVADEQNAAWIVMDGSQAVGFQILCFGPSLQEGKIEGQIVAFHVKPGMPRSVAPKMVEVMKEHARRVGAFRIIAGTQRMNRLRAFERLGGYAIAVWLVIPLGGCAENTNMTDVLKAMSTGTTCAKIVYAGATAEIQHTDVQNGNVTCNNEGLEVRSQPPTSGVHIQPNDFVFREN